MPELLSIESVQSETRVGRRHYRRPEERPFRASERGSTTILFGHLTEKHEAFIRAVFQGAGYRCEALPPAKVADFQLGREYCNNGLCNPTYFTAGSLIGYLKGLEERGLTRQQILDSYVYFTASGCGPCRFGMYEAEYRMALENAGFGGFRVLTFQSNRGVHQTDEVGLKYTMDFGLGMFNALNLGDVFYQLTYRIRPYEVRPGQTAAVIQQCLDDVAGFLRTRPPFEILEALPGAIANRLARHTKWKNILNNFGKYREHFWGRNFLDLLASCAARLNGIEVDYTQAKPLVKIVGEFYSQIGEGESNYNMFSFLENEGAEVSVDPIASLVMYWLYQARENHRRKRGLDPSPGSAFRKWMKHRGKIFLFDLSMAIWSQQYHRVARALGDVLPHLADQDELAQLARPYYHPLTRGGEGHLEVAKTIYYTSRKLCHMVLGLKPFGCMPSTQSDGVQAAVASHYPETMYAAIETSGEGEVNAHSRVQMALGEARRRARKEFEDVLAGTGRTLESIRDYTDAHPELRRPFYRFPRADGIAGTGANFIRHVAARMRS